jgi:hypothetical protein
MSALVERITLAVQVRCRMTTRPSDRENRRRRGRPKAGGSGIQISPRWRLSEIADIDRWSLSNGNPARAEAIRRIVNQVTGAPPAIAVPAQVGGPPVPRQEEPLLKAAPVSPSLHTSAEAIRRRVETALGSGPTRPVPNASQQPTEPAMTREQAAFLKASREGI